jgi:hypothetical protein
MNSGITVQAEALQSVNSLNAEEPFRISLSHSDDSTLNPGDNFEISLRLHAESTGEQDLCLLFVYREVCISYIVSDIPHLLPVTGWFGRIPNHSAPPTFHSAYSSPSHCNGTTLSLFGSHVSSQP